MRFAEIVVILETSDILSDVQLDGQMISTETWIWVVALTLVPALAFGQGIEEDPTGVEDMDPAQEAADERGEPAWLGIMMEEVDGAVRVENVIHGSPASRSGIEPGDVIREIGGKPVGSADAVQRHVRDATPEDVLSLTLDRDGKVLTERVELGAAPGLAGILRKHFVGRPAPTLEWRSVTSPKQTTKLEDIDRPIVVEFWATWCAPCKPMRDYLGKLSSDVGADVSFVAVSAEKLERIAAAGARENAGGKAYIPLGRVQKSALSEWIIEAYPTVFVIDTDGTVAGAFTGLRSRKAIGELVRKLATEQGDDGSDELLPAR